MKMKQMLYKVRDKIKVHVFRKTNLITYMEAKELLKEHSSAILLDVRSKQEYDEYHLKGAICIPTYELTKEITKIIEDKDQIIIVYCQSGARSVKAVKMLEKMGYINLYEIEGRD